MKWFEKTQWYKKSQVIISRQEIKNIISQWSAPVVGSVSYISNPVSLQKGYITKNQNQFTAGMGQIIRNVKGLFDQANSSIQTMSDDQLDRNILNFVRMMVNIDNYIQQGILYFGITPVGVGKTLPNFHNLVQKWRGL